MSKNSNIFECPLLPQHSSSYYQILSLWNSEFDQHAQHRLYFQSSCISYAHTAHLSSHFYILPIVHCCSWVVAAFHFDHQ